MEAPKFWDNQEKAQSTVSELKRLNSTIKPLEELSSGAGDLDALVELAAEDDSDSLDVEIQEALDQLQKKLAAVELRASMGRPEDSANAYVTVQAGEGGTDAADLADKLLRMYLRWCENNDYTAEIINRSDAEEAGIRNGTILVKGPFAFGYLKGETGNHRLVRISPFDSAGRRHTSFAAVDVTPRPR